MSLVEAQHRDASEIVEAPGDDLAEIYIYAVFPPVFHHVCFVVSKSCPNKSSLFLFSTSLFFPFCLSFSFLVAVFCLFVQNKDTPNRLTLLSFKNVQPKKRTRFF